MSVVVSRPYFPYIDYVLVNIVIGIDRWQLGLQLSDEWCYGRRFYTVRILLIWWHIYINLN